MELPEELLERIRNIRNKRAKIVVDHIMEKGYITTDELSQIGYNHPPRAARDVREEGIPLETKMVTIDGKRMAKYIFGDISKIEAGKVGGRKIFSKKLKEALYNQSEGKCFVCFSDYEIRYLQVDHRVPYEVSGDGEDFGENTQEYMLLCGSCQRAKSWSCEHCTNWLESKDGKICSECYWGSPEGYTHIATKPMRRTEIVWSGDEVQDYDRIRNEASSESVLINDFIKNLLHNRESKTK